jgi:hypothetical protein
LSAAGSNKATDSLFDTETFLRDNVDAPSRPFVAQLIGTQMFDRFVEDRVFSPMLPEVLFFDQSINQKLNRSITIGKKKYDCTFLDDRSDEVRETFIAPPPSNIGLPDDGTVYRVRCVSGICLQQISTNRDLLLHPPTVQIISEAEEASGSTSLATRKCTNRTFRMFTGHFSARLASHASSFRLESSSGTSPK